MRKLIIFTGMIVLNSGLLFAQVAINTNGNTADSSAILDLESTEKGFLLPRMTQAQMRAISDPAEGLIVYCTTDGKFYAWTTSINVWREISFGTGIIAGPWTICGDYITVNHVAGNVAPVSKTVTYGTVDGIPGELTKCWITHNLGADRQAYSVADATEASAGWYWQFNKKQGYKHDGTTRTPNTSWIGTINENSNWLAANDPCIIELGSGWRLPVYSEYNNIDLAGGWNSWNGPYGSALRMHAAGYLNDSNGNLSGRGTYGDYRSSTQFDNFTSWRLHFLNSNCYTDSESKVFGYTARCLRE